MKFFKNGIFLKHKNKKFSNNKKATNIALEMVVVAAALSIFLFFIINGLFPQLTHRLFPWFSGQGQYATNDCDEDRVIGITDKCPCNKEQSEDPKAVCGAPSEEALKNCPDLCKVSSKYAKK